MVITNQVLFKSSIQAFESPYGFPLPYVLLQDSGTAVAGGYGFQFDSISIFDSNNNPIAQPGDIFRYIDASTSQLSQTIVVGYEAANSWLLLNDVVNTNYGTVYKRNENPGCALFVNGADFGNGSINVELIGGAIITFEISSTKDYVLPFVAKSIEAATSQNGIYALY
jgi:hypothetical protein